MARVRARGLPRVRRTVLWERARGERTGALWSADGRGLSTARSTDEGTRSAGRAKQTNARENAVLDKACTRGPASGLRPRARRELL